MVAAAPSVRSIFPAQPGRWLLTRVIFYVLVGLIAVAGFFICAPLLGEEAPASYILAVGLLCATGTLVLAVFTRKLDWASVQVSDYGSFPFSRNAPEIGMSGAEPAAASDEPRLRFHRLIEQARPPQRADPAAAGALPTQDRYDRAVTTATGFGWWVFPPMDVQLVWDGHDIFWHFEGAPDWMPLSPDAQFPGFSIAFDKVAPKALHGCAPPFLTALREPGVLQIWTGLMARTAPGWSLLVRSPANFPSPGGYSVYEGIVETDRWFGPLFANLRLTRTHKPVHLRTDFPLLQVQPLPREAYAEQTLAATAVVSDMAGMTNDDWKAYGPELTKRPFAGMHAPTEAKPPRLFRVHYSSIPAASAKPRPLRSRAPGV
jgi:hypothetical protein